MLKMEIPGHKRPMVGLCSPLFEAVILSLLVVSECISSSDINHLKYMTTPEFVGFIPNVSVALGREATFTCNVKNLGNFRVGWVKADSKAIQSIHDSVITFNPRVKVSGDLQTTFSLHIEDVTEDDRGQYMCQINTVPMIYQSGFLDVKVQPDIDMERSSSDLEVRIGATAKLECYADGYPTPNISWLREEKSKNIKVKDPETGLIKMYKKFEGSTLTVPKVSPDDLGAYLCIANNGVPPSSSKRVFLYVQYPPEVTVPEQLVGALAGSPVNMSCEVSAYPLPIMFWKHKGKLVVTGDNFRVVETKLSVSRIVSTLIIRRAMPGYMGKFECMVKNSIGVSEASVRLYMITKSSSVPTSGNFQTELVTTTHEPWTRHNGTHYLEKQGHVFGAKQPKTADGGGHNNDLTGTRYDVGSSFAASEQIGNTEETLDKTNDSQSVESSVTVVPDTTNEFLASSAVEFKTVLSSVAACFLIMILLDNEIIRNFMVW